MADESVNCVIDEAARRHFEAAWQSGQPASIEQYLPPAHDPAYLGTLEEFVHIDLEFAWKSGLHPQAVSPRVEGYVARFPQLGASDIVRRLVRQEYRVRHQYGDRPPLAEYARRFPELSNSPGDLSEKQGRPPISVNGRLSLFRCSVACHKQASGRSASLPDIEVALARFC